MKKITLIIYLILIGLCYQCKTLQYDKPNRSNSNKSTKIENGQCFGKCLIPDQVHYSMDEYAVYTGNESEEEVDIEIKEILLQEKSTKWVKKKADRNCLSADPNDCLVWCLIEVPEIKKTLRILKDTTQSEHYEMKKIEYQSNIEKGGYTEWRAILCEQEATTLVIAQIQNALKEKSYYEEENTFKFDTRTKAALTKFQRDNGLPVGQLDLETLNVLGVIVGKSDG